MKTLNLKLKFFLTVFYLLFSFSNANCFENNEDKIEHKMKHKNLDGKDVCDKLNEKLYKYDINRRSFFHNNNRNFSLNYSKSYGNITRADGINSPMIEQRKKLDNLKNFNNGPGSVENFYGFSMQIPIETN